MITSFFVKIISLPIVLILSSFLLEQIHFSSVWQTIAVILILAIAGVTMEKLLLSERTFWLSIIADFVATVFLLWLLSRLFDGVAVALGAAVIISIIIAIQEYFVHLHLISAEN